MFKPSDNQLFVECICLLRVFRKHADALRSSQPLSCSCQGRGLLAAGVAGTSPGDKPGCRSRPVGSNLPSSSRSARGEAKRGRDAHEVSFSALCCLLVFIFLNSGLFAFFFSPPSFPLACSFLTLRFHSQHCSCLAVHMVSAISRAVQSTQSSAPGMGSVLHLSLVYFGS